MFCLFKYIGMSGKERKEIFVEREVGTLVLFVIHYLPQMLAAAVELGKVTHIMSTRTTGLGYTGILVLARRRSFPKFQGVPVYA